MGPAWGPMNFAIRVVMTSWYENILYHRSNDMQPQVTGPDTATFHPDLVKSRGRVIRV